METCVGLLDNQLKTYIGTKKVQAVPAVRIDGNVYVNGEETPKSGNREDGYKVIYEDGYQSWSPKDVFEKAYRIAETPIDRINIEYCDIWERKDKLNTFMKSADFEELDDVTRAMLIAQNKIQEDYMLALGLRSTKMETGEGGFSGFSFGVAITLLEHGFILRRSGWNGKDIVVFKQVPAHIDGTIIPNMQSLPKSAKSLIMDSAAHIDYTSQCLIYNQKTGRADSWVPSVSDVFATDWELVPTK